MATPLNRPLRIGTRGSKLARWQSDHVAQRLRTAHPALAIEIVIIQSSGDLDRTTPLDAFGQTGVFTKELESALLDGRCDVAVHSLKDMPTASPAGLIVRPAGPRADPRDVLITRNGVGLDALKKSALIGTGSIRRVSQLHALRADLRTEGIRGNVETRLQKVDSGEFDGVMLALAGLSRLNLAARASDMFEIEEIVPAPGQGILGIQWREADEATTAVLAPLWDPMIDMCAAAERTFLKTTQAGCHAPVGAVAVFGHEPWAAGLDSEDADDAEYDRGSLGRDIRGKADAGSVSAASAPRPSETNWAAAPLRIIGFIGSADGRDVYFAESQGTGAQAASLGADLATSLLNSGAKRVLSKIQARRPT